jgi:ABC-2 type transport system permease protein
MMSNIPMFNLINALNPAAVVTDAISALNLYSNYNIFMHKVLIMLVITALFSFGGFILTRRKKYASL